MPIPTLDPRRLNIFLQHSPTLVVRFCYIVLQFILNYTLNPRIQSVYNMNNSCLIIPPVFPVSVHPSRISSYFFFFPPSHLSFLPSSVFLPGFINISLVLSGRKLPHHLWSAATVAPMSVSSISGEEASRLRRYVQMFLPVISIFVAFVVILLLLLLLSFKKNRNVLSLPRSSEYHHKHRLLTRIQFPSLLSSISFSFHLPSSAFPILCLLHV